MDNETKDRGEILLTPRLVFNNSVRDDDDDIPAFLKKDYEPRQKPRLVEPAASPVVLADEPKTVEAVVEPPHTEPVIAAAQDAPITEGKPVTETSSTNNSGENDTPNLDELSVEDLRRQQEEIARRIQEKQEAEKQAIIDQIVEVVTTYKIPIDDLVSALGGIKVRRKGVKAVQKYRDPATGATWSGRGKEPAWIKDKDRKPFLIK